MRDAFCPRGYISPQLFAHQMKRLARIAAHGEKEWAHKQADDLMLRVLWRLSYHEGVTIFKEMPRWYS